MAQAKRGLGRGLSELMGQASPATPQRESYSASKKTSKKATKKTTKPTDVFFNADVSRETSGRQTMPTVADILGHAPRQISNAEGTSAGTLMELEISSIHPNAQQPRTVFDEDELEELAASIKDLGVLQPIVVRPVGNGYELIMGERRWRASQLAGKKTIPAVVREVDDNNLLRDALVENIHRSQLNPLEEAAAYEQLLKDFKCTQADVAKMLSKSRAQVTNTLRLLRLPAPVQRRVAAGVISAGHARALLGLPNAAAMEVICDRIVKEGLSVRATEELVAMSDNLKPQRRKKNEDPVVVSAQVRARETKLMDLLDTNVSVKPGKSKGRIVIDYADEADLDRIIGVISR